VSEELGLGDLKVSYTLSLIGFFLFNEISLSISLFCCCTFAFANSLFIFFISVTSSSGVNDVFIESSTVPSKNEIVLGDTGASDSVSPLLSIFVTQFYCLQHLMLLNCLFGQVEVVVAIPFR